MNGPVAWLFAMSRLLSYVWRRCRFPAGKENARYQAGEKDFTMQLYFDRSRLPTPETVLRLVGAEKVTARGLNLSARCPFPDHADRNPSFSMHGLSGSWICFGCHRRGGDVLALYQGVTGLSFRDAVTAMDAWGQA